MEYEGRFITSQLATFFYKANINSAFHSIIIPLPLILIYDI